MISSIALIEMLQSAPTSFQELVEGVSDAALRYSPDGEWSIAGVITHLGLNEIFVRERLGSIVTAHEPVLTVFRSDESIPAAGNPMLSVIKLWQQWQTQRRHLCGWLAERSPEDWQRRAIHPQRGQTTLYMEAIFHSGHDAAHLEQVLTVRHKWKSRYGNIKGEARD